jgi:predicted nuclease of predicted toxin-antitoxin system
MRFLADENFPLDSVRLLRSRGHDALAAAESLSGSRDEQILALAARDGRVLLTFDRDYGELIYRRGLPVPPVDPPKIRQRPLPRSEPPTGSTRGSS